MSNPHNVVLDSLRHLNQRYDQTTQQMNDFSAKESAGENPDPAEFSALMERQSTTHTAMTAQFSLLQKPLKTVLNESK